MLFGKRGELACFGKSTREKYFDYDKNVVNLNHGAYGLVSRPTLAAQIEALQGALKFPDKYMREDIHVKTNEARRLIADMLDADFDGLVLTTNATTALNAVLRSYPFNRGDKIVMLSTVYVSMRNTLSFMEEKMGIDIVPVMLDYPLNDNAILADLENAISAQPLGSVKFALFDTVSSEPSARLPWEEMCDLCRSHGVLSIVDGAHGIGLIPISLREARPDFFTTNLHKWMYVNHAVAALYVAEPHRRKVNSLPVSSVYDAMNEPLDPELDRTELARTFAYVGVADHSVVDSVTAAFKFYKDVCGGQARVMEYQNNLAKEGRKLFCDALGVRSFTTYDDQQNYGMFSVTFPLQSSSEQVRNDILQFVHNYFLDHGKTYIPLKSYDGVLYMRISCPIYLDLNDLRWGVEAVREVVDACENAIGDTIRESAGESDGSDSDHQPDHVDSGSDSEFATSSDSTFYGPSESASVGASPSK